MTEYLRMARDLGGPSHRSLNLSTGLHAGDVRRVWKKEKKSNWQRLEIIELTFNIELDLPWSGDSQLVVSGASVDPSALPPSRGDQHLVFTFEHFGCFDVGPLAPCSKHLGLLCAAKPPRQGGCCLV